MGLYKDSLIKYVYELDDKDIRKAHYVENLAGFINSIFQKKKVPREIDMARLIALNKLKEKITIISV